MIEKFQPKRQAGLNCASRTRSSRGKGGGSQGDWTAKRHWMRFFSPWVVPQPQGRAVQARLRILAEACEVPGLLPNRKEPLVLRRGRLLHDYFQALRMPPVLDERV